MPEMGGKDRDAGVHVAALAVRVEEIALRILHEEHPERPQSTNVEFYSAGVLQAIGLPREYFTPTFATARVAGTGARRL